jgi:hypothetical protein
MSCTVMELHIYFYPLNNIGTMTISPKSFFAHGQLYITLIKLEFVQAIVHFGTAQPYKECCIPQRSVMCSMNKSQHFRFTALQ